MRIPVFVYILLVALVVLNAGTLTYLWMQKSHHGPPGPHPDGNPGMHPPAFDQVLEFDGAQLDRFHELQHSHHQIKDSLDQQAGTFRAALLGQIIDGDSTGALQYADSIGKTRAASEAEVVRFFSSIRNMCTGTQVSRFDTIMMDLQQRITRPSRP